MKTSRPANVSFSGVGAFELSKPEELFRRLAGELQRSAEPAHILGALGETNSVFGGSNDAAARFGMKPTTLQCGMQHLGIPRMR
jgi:hypothetical protein